MLTIRGKAIGRKKPLFADFSIPIHPDACDGSLSLRELIARIVHHEVDAFRKRQEERQFLKALTAGQIDEGVASGKVLSGESLVEPQDVDAEEAVEAALTAFEDGLYLVAIDDSEYRELDQQVYLQPDSRVTFIRLTLLAGG